MEERKRRKPTSCSLLLTQDCTLACKYCFEVEKRDCSKDMPLEVIDAALEYLFRNAVEQKDKQVHVMLFGGEPLLKPELCERTLSKGLELSKKTGVEFMPRLITNATIMNPKIELLLYKWSKKIRTFGCQLSIDGWEESQNLYRVKRDGTGSWDMVSKNVDKFLEIFEGNINIHGCINRQTLPHLYENFKKIRDRWAAGRRVSIWYMPIHTEAWTMEDVNLYDEQLSLICDDMLTSGDVNCFSPLNKNFRTCRDGQPEKTCTAGVSFVTFTDTGDIYPCHNIFFNDPLHETKLGNLFENGGELDGEIIRLFEENNTEKMGCGGCENVDCYRCLADNWRINRDINAQVGRPVRCLMSGVERKYQLKLREEAEKRGLLKQKTGGGKRFEDIVLSSLSDISEAVKFLLARSEGIVIKEEEQ